MIAQKDSSMDDIALYIANRWQRNTPKLVLSIIGRSDYHVPWLKTKFMEDFHDGIIQVWQSVFTVISFYCLTFVDKKWLATFLHNS